MLDEFIAGRIIVARILLDGLYLVKVDGVGFDRLGVNGFGLEHIILIIIYCWMDLLSNGFIFMWW